jgi:hypothetical protein
MTMTAQVDDELVRQARVETSRRGATMQICLALIPRVLLQLYTGRRPNKRMMERAGFYMLGWAPGEELSRGLERYRSELARGAKKS